MNMSHQPYETWLFDPGELTPQQSAELAAHLETCDECKQIQAAWLDVHQLIRRDAAVSVPAGFTQRFSASLPERKARERSRQIRRTLFLLGGGVILFSLVFLGIAIATISPADFLTRTVQALTAATETWDQIGLGIQFLLNLAPPIVPIFLGMALLGWVLILTMTWIFTMKRFSIKGEGNR
jgi:hypothetical protein